MRKHYRQVRELTLRLAGMYNGGISEESAGLHFLLDIAETSPLIGIYRECGVKVSPLAEHYDSGSDIPQEAFGRYVVNYSSADIEALDKNLNA